MIPKPVIPSYIKIVNNKRLSIPVEYSQYVFNCSAAKELQGVDSDSIGEVAKITARSSLMGARGNSGVILSQLFRGIARGLSGKEEASLSELGRAFQYGIVYAYNAVNNPVEGTILTVAREIAKGSREAIQTPGNYRFIAYCYRSGRSTGSLLNFAGIKRKPGWLMQEDLG